jgi:hypothetical protein
LRRFGKTGPTSTTSYHVVAPSDTIQRMFRIATLVRATAVFDKPEEQPVNPSADKEKQMKKLMLALEKYSKDHNDFVIGLKDVFDQTIASAHEKSRTKPRTEMIKHDRVQSLGERLIPDFCLYSTLSQDRSFCSHLMNIEVKTDEINLRNPQPHSEHLLQSAKMAAAVLKRDKHRKFFVSVLIYPAYYFVFRFHCDTLLCKVELPMCLEKTSEVWKLIYYACQLPPAGFGVNSNQPPWLNDLLFGQMKRIQIVAESPFSTVWQAYDTNDKVCYFLPYSIDIYRFMP